MSKSKKTLITVAVVLGLGVVLALGVTAATTVLAAPAAQTTQTPNGTQTPGQTGPLAKYSDTWWQNLATRLNTTVDALKQAFTGASNDTVDQALKDGQITQSQADSLKNRIQTWSQNGSNIPFGLFGRGGRGHKGGFGEIFLQKGELMTAFAKALNTDEQTLLNDLRNGQTIADIAKSKNIDVATVKTSVLADMKASLQSAVSAGNITQAQADTAYQTLSDKIDNLINNTFPGKGPGFEFKHNFGGNHAPAPTQAPTQSGTGG